MSFGDALREKRVSKGNAPREKRVSNAPCEKRVGNALREKRVKGRGEIKIFNQLKREGGLIIRISNISESLMLGMIL